jgi:nucleotide-binding universal stress UspA family protein
MADTIVLCADGSELSTHALGRGLAQLEPASRTVIVTVVEVADATLVMGTGIAGGTMSPGEYDTLERERVEEAQTVLRDVATALSLPDAETHVLRGDAGAALCDYATEIAARVIVIGTRGRGGLKRAFLGSVSDYVVRNAPCPVVVTGAHGD